MKHQYSDKPVTPWGGMKEMKELIDKTGISEQIKKIGIPEGKSNNRISGISIIESFWVSVWIGCFKFTHTSIVRLDEVLKQLFGWKRVASGTTFTRYFRRFGQVKNQYFFLQLYQWFFTQLKFDNYVLDVDSSVITRYGEQQGARKGYNPKKRGRNSHHPLFAFVSDLRMVANCWNRSGNTSSSNNCIAFLEETFEILKNKKVGLFRADSGFCSQSILHYLENKEVAYVMSCKLYANLQEFVYNLKKWNNIDEGLWLSETEYQQGGWDKSRRIIIIKQLEEIRPKATGKKLRTLFDDVSKEDEKVYKARYHVLVTNQTLPATEIWNQYKHRSDAENRIKELKEDFGVDGFCMNDFWATETAMRMTTIAYNLMSLFRQLSSQTRPSPTLRTLRFNCFAVGSWIVKEGRNKVLKMSVPLKRRQWYDGLFSAVNNFSIPISLSG